MPKLPFKNFSNQKKIIFKSFFEFFNIKSQKNFFLYQNFLFRISIKTLVFLYLNKLFFVIEYQDCLFNVSFLNFENKNLLKINCSQSGSHVASLCSKNFFSLLKLRESGDRISIKKKYCFEMNLELIIKPKHLGIKQIHFFEYGNIENFFNIYFKNRKILIFNIKKKSKILIKLDSDIIRFNLFNNRTGSGFFYESHDSKISINCFNDLNILNFSNIENHLFSNSLIKKKSTVLEMVCICHEIVKKKIVIETEFKSFFFIDPRIIYVCYKSFIGKSDFKKCKVIKCEFHNYNYYDLCSTQKLLRKISFDVKIKNNYSTSFLNDDYIMKKNSISEKGLVLTSIPIRIGYFEKINDLCFFGTRLSIVIASEKNTIKIFSGSDFKFSGEHSLGSDEVIKFEIIDTVLISMNSRGKIIFLNLLTGKVFSHFFPCTGKTFIFKIKKKRRNFDFVTGDKEGVVSVWRIRYLSVDKIEKKLTFTKNFKSGSIFSMAISSKKNFLSFSTLRKEIFLWNFDSLKEYEKLDKLKKFVYSLLFSPQAKILVAGTSDGCVLIYDVKKKILLKKLNGNKSAILKSIFFKNLSFLISTDENGRMLFWNLEENFLMNDIKNHMNSIWSFDISKDNKWIATGCSAGKIVIIKNIENSNSKKKQNVIEQIFDLFNFTEKKEKFETFSFNLQKISIIKSYDLLRDFLLFSLKDSPKKNSDALKNIFKNSNFQIIKIFQKAIGLWIEDEKGMNLIRKIFYLLIEAGNSRFFYTLNKKILLFASLKISDERKRYKFYRSKIKSLMNRDYN